MDSISTGRLRRSRSLLAAAVTMAALVLLAAPVGAGGTATERADVLTQDESGVLQPNGARLTRAVDGLTVEWRVHTPEPGSYLYPTADQVPPGAPPHPAIVPGAPEVFSLWAFVFSHPELCTPPMCDFDDVGPATAAQGGIYQLDATVADHELLEMSGRVRLGMQPAAGAALSNPLGAEAHIAMTSHGMALSGSDLARQLNGAVGGPPNWWVALFL